MSNAIGPLPEKFKADTKDIGTATKNERMKAYKKINLLEQKYLHELRKPYCRRSTRDAFVAVQLALWNQKGATACNPSLSNDRKTEENVLVKGFDFEQFAKEDYFVLLGENPCIETKLLDGMRTTVRTGTWKSYQCKRGFKIRILTPDMPVVTQHSVDKLASKPKK